MAAHKRVFLLIPYKAFWEALVYVLDEEPDSEVVFQEPAHWPKPPA